MSRHSLRFTEVSGFYVGAFNKLKFSDLIQRVVKLSLLPISSSFLFMKHFYLFSFSLFLFLLTFFLAQDV